MRGGNRLGFAAVGVAGLGAKRFKLAGTALHPEQNASHSAAAKFGSLGGDQIGPIQQSATQSAGQRAQRNAFEKITTTESAIAIGFDAREMMELDGHGRPRSLVRSRPTRSG
jgi:hypothetical protein